MFGRLRERLLKKSWTADQLAQELYAMFDPEAPLFHEGPIELRRRDDQPFFTLSNFAPGDILFNVNGAGGRHYGDVILGDDGLGLLPEGETQLVGIGTTVQGGSGGIPGAIVSGSGDTYQVTLYENGITEDATKTVEVKQLQITGDDLDAGTEVVVYLGSDGVYFMQHPVWV
jgi:hypothetical protein